MGEDGKRKQEEKSKRKEKRKRRRGKTEEGNENRGEETKKKDFSWICDISFLNLGAGFVVCIVFTVFSSMLVFMPETFYHFF